MLFRSRGPFPFPSQQVLKGPLAYKVPEAGLGQLARVQGSPCAGAVLSLAQTHRGRPQNTSTRLYAGGDPAFPAHLRMKPASLGSGRLAQPCFWVFVGQGTLDHLLGWEREGSTNCTLDWEGLGAGGQGDDRG